jgi:hypothetical protein
VTRQPTFHRGQSCKTHQQHQGEKMPGQPQATGVMNHPWHQSKDDAASQNDACTMVVLHGGIKHGVTEAKEQTQPAKPNVQPRHPQQLGVLPQVRWHELI